jgi:arylsulfatase A-like enzyme
MIAPRSRGWLARVLFGLVGSCQVVWAQPNDAIPKAGRHYNVLFIVVDDYDASITSVANPNAPVKTPNMERIAQRSVWFANAYNAAPACCPSRTALLTGVEPSRSGVYLNTQPYRRSATFISKVDTLPRHFLRNGYLTGAYGKFVHNRFIEDDISDYTPGYYKMFDRDVINTEAMLEKAAIPGTRVKGVPAIKGFGMLPDDWDRQDTRKIQQDTEQANRTIEFLRQQHTGPFLLACGFWRPHSLWFVPQRYYDMHPLSSINLPPGYREDDLDDVPPSGLAMAVGRKEHAVIASKGLWKPALQAYYAAVSYVDEQIGRVLDALESSPYNDSTILIFFGDNGYHLGEKDHWTKYALWEQTCRVPLAISVPGISAHHIQAPVGLIDLYPTLINLCGLTGPQTHELDGVDLGPLLRGEISSRGRAVLSTYGRANHSITDGRFRYIRYRNGDEELYDHREDPFEWRNLASDRRFRPKVEEMTRVLPKYDAPDIAAEADDGEETGKAAANPTRKGKTGAK